MNHHRFSRDEDDFDLDPFKEDKDNQLTNTHSYCQVSDHEKQDLENSQVDGN